MDKRKWAAESGRSGRDDHLIVFGSGPVAVCFSGHGVRTLPGDSSSLAGVEFTGLVLDYGGVVTDPGETVGRVDEPPMVSVARKARRAGIRMALLSNAEVGPEPPKWSELFDVTVLSGAVGMAKPDVEIYRLTARKLGVPPHACVFVDDLRSNVSGAVAAGMVGVQHCSVPATLAELEVLFAPVALC